MGIHLLNIHRKSKQFAVYTNCYARKQRCCRRAQCTKWMWELHALHWGGHQRDRVKERKQKPRTQL